MELHKCPKRRPPTEFNMKPARIIFLVVIALSSFSGAAENGGDLWWPQFRGPNSSGLGGGKPPVHFGPGQNVQGKAAPFARKPIWRHRFTNSRGRIVGVQPSGERGLSSGPQSPRRANGLADGSLIVSVRMVHSCALAS